MKIVEVVKKLEEIGENFGDVECLIEVMYDDVVATVPVDELAVEDRDGYGVSVKFIE